MPSPAEQQPMAAPLPSLCIFGDSHIASVRQALDAGLLPYVSDHLEFWGAYGPAFRQFEYQDNTVLPRKDAEEMVAMINGHGRLALRGDAFSAYLFYGARLRIADFLPPMLATLRQGGHLSAAVRQRVVRRFLEGRKSYRIAQQFARANPGVSVTFAPAPLLTLGVGVPEKTWPEAEGATADERAEALGWLDAEAGLDGITLLHQPEETIVQGCWTDPHFAATGPGSEDDPVHKSPAFAALMLSRYRALLAG
ncbi:hypothetical protein [Oceanicola sp. S124]|uniref:hypothetical protein n=1 Tax=Oceanicola sp. S124 TaxID=1042378 RepID=UPI0002559CD6|nr:hypothetical protein [Oceanicola sp. S124]